jgi:hypothetical protein
MIEKNAIVLIASLAIAIASCSSPPHDRLTRQPTTTATSGNGATNKSGNGSTTSSANDGDTSAFAPLVKNDAYRTSGLFEEITSKPYASQAAAGSTISVWVSRQAASSYARVDPDEDGSDVVLPRGSMIVREVRDASGAVTKLTVMAKGPSGYNPDVGDWFWLVASADGVVIDDADGGAAMDGKMPQCHSCHLPRAHDDFLFGVPAASKADHP